MKTAEKDIHRTSNVMHLPYKIPVLILGFLLAPSTVLDLLIHNIYVVDLRIHLVFPFQIPSCGKRTSDIEHRTNMAKKFVLSVL